MRFRGKFVRRSFILGAIAVLAIISVFWQKGAKDKEGSSGFDILLTSPAFAQEAGANFLEQEAGISAYMNAGRSIDLTKVKTVFRTLERDTNEYIIGSIPLPGYPETEDVHVYVHKDGWIVAYYLKAEPAAKVLDWNSYVSKITGTKLEVGMLLVCGSAEVSMKDVKYYDFRYPDANKMMIVAEGVFSPRHSDPITETFKLKLPSQFVFYERSFSYLSSYASDRLWMYIDDKLIRTGTNGTVYGILSPTLLTLDAFHVVSISSAGWTSTSWGAGSGVAFGAIVLIYQEP